MKVYKDARPYEDWRDVEIRDPIESWSCADMRRDSSSTVATRFNQYVSVDGVVAPAECLHSREINYEWDTHGLSDDREFSEIAGEWIKFVNPPTLIPNPSGLRRKFEDLVREWEHDTMLSSSSHEIIMHPAYQRVIGIGERALPLIFEELKRGKGHWHWALCAITGENPAASTDSLREAAKEWLAWAEERDFLLRHSE